MAWIDIVTPERAEGALAELYDSIAGARGGVAEVHQVQSLNPKAMAARLELYTAVVFQRSSLSLRQRERIGVGVSAANACAYCVAHHGQALRGLGEDQRVANALERGDLDAALTIGCFCFVNRLVLMLGVQLEERYEATCGPDQGAAPTA